MTWIIVAAVLGLIFGAWIGWEWGFVQGKAAADAAWSDYARNRRRLDVEVLALAGKWQVFREAVDREYSFPN